MQSYTWFFSLENALTAEQEAQLQADFKQFTDQWQSHGTPVDGLIRIRYNRFVIVQANPAEARPSGCSIDSLRRGVEQILAQRGYRHMEPMWVFFRDTEGEIQRAHFQQMGSLLAEGKISAQTPVFDHSLSHSDDLNLWERPLAETWMKRFLPQEA